MNTREPCGERFFLGLFLTLAICFVVMEAVFIYDRDWLYLGINSALLAESCGLIAWVRSDIRKIGAPE